MTITPLNQNIHLIHAVAHHTLLPDFKAFTLLFNRLALAGDPTQDHYADQNSDQKQKRVDDGAKLWVLVVNKPEIVQSDLYFIRDGGVEIVKLDRLASRSRDVVPHMKNL
jgi:hypothetical protein